MNKHKPITNHLPCVSCGFRRAEARVEIVDGRFTIIDAESSGLCSACRGRAVADEPVDESDVVADSAT